METPFFYLPASATANDIDMMLAWAFLHKLKIVLIRKKRSHWQSWRMRCYKRWALRTSPPSGRRSRRSMRRWTMRGMWRRSTLHSGWIPWYDPSNGPSTHIFLKPTKEMGMKHSFSRCDVCNLELNSYDTLASHEKGMRHMVRRLQSLCSTM